MAETPTPTPDELGINKTEAAKSPEVVENREAMEKLVDIMSTPDLKYRMEHPSFLPLTLEAGAPTPLSEFLKEPFGQPKLGVIREAKFSREQARRGKVSARDWANKANVFYPEGALNYLRDVFLGKNEVALFSHNLKEIREVASGQLSQVLEKLDKDPEYQKTLGSNRREIVEALHTIGKYADGNFRMGKGKDLWETFPGSEQGNYARQALSDPRIWEQIRREALNLFFESGKTDHGDGVWQAYSYQLTFGYIIAPDAKVALSHSYDFPTQATILEARLKPRKIIGLIANPDRPNAGREFTDVTTDIRDETVDALTALTTARYHTPTQVAAYALEKYRRPFASYLEQKGINRSQIEKLISAFDRERKYENLPGEIQKELASAPGAARYNDALRKRNWFISNQLEVEFGNKAWKQVSDAARLFFEKFSPIKDGESLMTGLLRLAEKYQMPIYTTRGELLWPKKMSGDAVSAAVAKKAKVKK